MARLPFNYEEFTGENADGHYDEIDVNRRYRLSRYDTETDSHDPSLSEKARMMYGAVVDTVTLEDTF